VEDAIRKLIKDGVRKLVLDLTDLSYIDSSGVGLIVTCTGEMGQTGGQIRVAGAQGVVARPFEIVRLTLVVPQDPDVETACSALSAAAAS
jgi:anti-anti-sigma factor